ncbi:DEAD/DEAH box helicase [Brevundimonas sp.]|uniref:DEAD/DEAH box helicase n=1 Tax=Brevundimonas sp. TaxID=1871086 RepID=UPI00289D96D1|nr:DEAD/DEAH box helicase [Brevundimonas sp.]
MQGFDRLHREVQRWIRDEGWTGLRPIQSRAIDTVLGGETDVIISAATAAGKTEAAFLPLLSRVAEREDEGLSILYVSPLKALINDQHRRLDGLCERLGLPAVRWHGDAPAGPKQRLLKTPAGVVFITPESIEALFLRRSAEVPRLFGRIDAVVIDELHAFLQGPRGLHLACLLRRIELATGQRPRRIGLSATLGDPVAASIWMNPTAPERVVLIEDAAAAINIHLQIRGYLEPNETCASRDGGEVEEPRTALDDIADHAFGVLRGDNHLFFASSRRNVEALADGLRLRSEAAAVPNEFFPHHGSLSRELRETLESRLKAAALPTTAVATTTLELGIDLGGVKSVAQLGAPRSLASLRQRLGRSGRRKGAPAILRVYVRERSLVGAAGPLDALRPETIRAVAAVRLLLQRYVEPPRSGVGLATVAIHQILSLIVERGGVSAGGLFNALCGAGPLVNLDRDLFLALLRGMGDPAVRLIEQAQDGQIMLGELGERLTSNREFYAIFDTDEEWTLRHGVRALGQIPISNVLFVGSVLAFAGRRWRVTGVDDRAKVLNVEPHRAGRLPLFERQSVEPLGDRLAQEMRSVYLSQDLPAYADPAATALLQEGRDAFAAYDLTRHAVLADGPDTHLLLWRGGAMNSVMAVALRAMGAETEVHDLGVTLAQTSPDRARALLESVAAQSPSVSDLSGYVANLSEAKFDAYAPPDVLRRLWEIRHGASVAELSKLAAGAAHAIDMAPPLHLHST